jgi:hypothetical protein
MALSEATMNEKENKPGQRAANKGFGKKLADATQHQHFAIQLRLSVRHYKFGNRNNDQLLIL